MGLGNFFDNFMGGLAFGMLANNPFFGGMGCYGYGFGGSNMQRIDFGTFANPFPNPFGNMKINDNSSPQISIFTDFGNPGYPSLDFSNVWKTICNNTLNPDSEFNKRMKEYYENLNKCNNVSNNSQNKFTCYDMPFSGWYLPTQIPFGGYFSGNFTPQLQSTSISTTMPKTEVKADADKTSLEPKDTDSELQNNESISYDISELKAKWSKKKNLPDAFYNKVIQISKKIKCNPNDLMGVMWYETAHTFDPSKTNSIGAVGLIQFMPDTAKKLGTTSPKLKSMSAVEQLEYVEKYLVASKESAGYKDNETLSRGTLYSLVFLPGRSKRTVLTSRGENFYEQNKKNLDYNNDGKITKADLHSVITNHLA